MRTFAIIIAFTFVISELAGQNFDPVERLQNHFLTTGNAVPNNNVFSPESLEHLAFSGDENLDSIHHWQWNSIEGVWDPSSKSLYLYNGNGNNTQIRTVTPENDTIWEETLWGNNFLITHIYNNNHQVTQTIYQSWYISGWINYSQGFYTYDSSGNLTETYFQNWMNEEWVDQSRTTRSYDADNKLIQSVEERFNEDEWESDSWTTYTYGSNGLLEIEHMLHLVTGSIYKEFRNVYFYNGQNQLTQISTQNPIGPVGGGQWEDIYHVLYTYNNSTTTVTNERITQNGWERTVQRVLIHEDDKLTIELYRYWYPDENKWATIDSSYYYYSPPTGVESVFSEGSIMIYPNPATTTINVTAFDSTGEALNLSIYSSNGVLILESSMLEAGKSFEIGDLIPGVYFLIFYNNELIRKSRFVKL